MGCEIEFDHLSFGYGPSDDEARDVLQDVNFGIGNGECVCVTGPSGCGKTTLTRLINGLIPSFYEGRRRGRVLIHGRDAEQWSMDDLCRVVGSVFQNPRSQFFNLDTTSELAYGCENLGIPRDEMIERIARVVADLGLHGLVGREIHDLSGGQRQLLSLGAACAMGAEAFVLDEPTANLDATAVRLVKRTLQRLKDQGKTVVIVEHRLHWLSGLADRVVLMDAGRVVGDYAADAFAALPDCTLAEMGLRAWSLTNLSLHADADAGGLHAERRSGTDIERSRAGVHPGIEEGSSRAAARPRMNAGFSRAFARLDMQADGLRAAYARGGEVLKGASFRASGGHSIAVIGRNGQGKSTLARVMAGLMRETYGGISIDAKPLSARDRAGNVYLVFQESGYQLFSSSVRREFAVGRDKAFRLSDDEVDRLMADFGLEGKQERHPASLSGGEKQRLALAVGVSAGARVLVLDEPTSGLDKARMSLAAAQIRALVRTGRCVFVVTHDIELVAEACDQVMEIDRGRVRDAYDLDRRTFSRVLSILAPDAVDLAPDAVDRAPRGVRRLEPTGSSL